MERVNLIPDDLAVTWVDRVLLVVDKQFFLVLAVAVATVGLLEAGMGVAQGLAAKRYAGNVSTLEARRSTLVADIDTANAYIKQLDQAEDELKQQTQRLMQRIRYLSVYREAQGEWAVTLQEIKRAIPYGVWLTDLESGLQGQLRIAGGAFENRLVTQFMGQLKDSPKFANVAFNYTKQSKIGNTSVVEFEVTCQALTAVGAAS